MNDNKSSLESDKSRITEILIESNALNEERLKHKNLPWKTIAFYVTVGILWILFSDKVLDFIVSDHAIYMKIQSYKGIFYVLITALMLYFLIKNDYSKIFRLSTSLSEKNELLLNYSQDLHSAEKQLKDKILHLNSTLENLNAYKDYIHTIVNNSHTGIMTWKLNGEIFEINEHFKILTGYNETELVGSRWQDIILDKDDRKAFNRIVKNLEENNFVHNVETRLLTKDGRVLNILSNNSLIQNPMTKEKMAVSFGIDITDKKRNERKIIDLAYKDQLTGMNNRFVFERDIRRRIESKQAFTLYYIDIDNFRSINEIYGHRYGDEFIKNIALDLEKYLGNCNFYRWCGDEFMVLDDSNTRDNIDAMTKRLVEITTDKWTYEHMEYYPSASIGIVQYPHDGDCLDDIFKNIDIALHHAKVSGKSKVSQFNVEFQKAFERKVAVENLIYESIKANSFLLNYQPIYNSSTKDIYGVETLLRLASNRDNISMGEFIAVAEETGHIIKIDRWVIENTFKFIAENLMDKNIVISINLSAKSVENSDTIGYLAKCLEKYPVNAKKIEFEITEHSLIEDIEQSIVFIEALKKLGFRLALDDFGTRYSSLNYLSKIEFDTLKIDKSYIDKIANNSKSYAIVENVIHLSHQIGLTTIAEGVEEELQSDVLKSMNCDLVQGYLLSRPMKAHNLLELLNE